MADPKIVEYLSQIQRVVDRYTADRQLVEDVREREAIRKEIAKISREMQEYRMSKYNRRDNS